MKIQYINSLKHEVIDDEVYVFHPMEIKEVSDRLGNYLIGKYPISFIKAKPIEKTIHTGNIMIDEKIENIKITIYRKLRNKDKFIKLPTSQDVKFA